MCPDVASEMPRAFFLHRMRALVGRQISELWAGRQRRQQASRSAVGRAAADSSILAHQLSTVFLVISALSEIQMRRAHPSHSAESAAAAARRIGAPSRPSMHNFPSGLFSIIVRANRVAEISHSAGRRCSCVAGPFVALQQNRVSQ